eukprot:CAMPEP_0201475952 /NCGR_PEP_ID=MMETSP0151_2-20130828/1252_1 /ASSEMBLY_ACC=CAM_ASM_000257 /TAXON_ID=200890 /ORGANISM="Paramoeba atlantica, Strain 621/1 / CCAP 1560/9" /LENGTH=278 /DNA_ID=CAMNT_0047856169 /DNA_START=208 /DNA_END=1044 /DNA_ORIENTATION=-
MRYDTESSVITKSSSFPDLTLFTTESPCAISPEAIFYVNALNLTEQTYSIYGISLYNGTILTVDPSPTGIIGVPQLSFNSNQHEIIFTSQNPQNGNWDQYVIDPNSGFSYIKNSFVESKFLPSGTLGSSFDPINSIQWTPASQGGGTRYQVGLALNGTVFLVKDPGLGKTPVYSDLSDGTMYAWATDEHNNRVIEKWGPLDKHTVLQTQVQSSAWEFENGSIGFILKANTIYGTFSIESPGTKDYFLVGIDLESGATKSAVLLSQDTIPWCLGSSFVN